jgi:hypothetical protein
LQSKPSAAKAKAFKILFQTQRRALKKLLGFAGKVVAKQIGFGAHHNWLALRTQIKLSSASFAG